MTERDPKIQKVVEPLHADGPVLERLRTRGYSVLDALMTTSVRDDGRLHSVLGEPSSDSSPGVSLTC